jgi:hypothetical protein
VCNRSDERAVEGRVYMCCQYEGSACVLVLVSPIPYLPHYCSASLVGYLLQYAKAYHIT